MKYRKLQRVTVQDPDYKAFGAARRMENLKFRKKIERTASDKLSDYVEDAVRSILDELGTSDDCRIWKYERLKQGAYVEEYREMDFVCRNSEGVLLFGEVKSSNNASALRKAKEQVSKNLRLARLAEERAHGVIVQCGSSEEFVEGPEAITSIWDRLAEVGDEMLVLRISQQRLGEGLKGKTREKWDDLFTQVLEERAATEARRSEREKLRSDGVPEEDWPEHLRQRGPQELDDAPIQIFGESNDNETAMERALREAREKSKNSEKVEHKGKEMFSIGISDSRSDGRVGFDDATPAKKAWWRKLVDLFRPRN